MSIICANVKISGTRPLLFNRFTEEAIPITKQEKWGVPGNNPQEWKNFSSNTTRTTLFGSHLYFLLFTRRRKIYIQKEEEL